MRTAFVLTAILVASSAPLASGAPAATSEKLAAEKPPAEKPAAATEKPVGAEPAAEKPSALAAKPDAPPKSDKPEYEPTSAYVPRQIEGWTVLVHHRLLAEEKELGDETLKLLGMHLYVVNRQVPKPALDRLHEVRIWVEANNPKVACMCYHPSREWLAGHGFNPEKARSVELGNPRNFIDWTHHQWAMVLHELAHAYHHQVLGYDNPDIKAAYKHAMDEKLYDSVLRYDGQKVKAYATTSDQEFFAELSESYFSTNDFYPFVRAEVMQYDPRTFEMLKKVWGEPARQREKQ